MPDQDAAVVKRWTAACGAWDAFYLDTVTPIDKERQREVTQEKLDAGRAYVQDLHRCGFAPPSGLPEHLDKLERELKPQPGG